MPTDSIKNIERAFTGRVPVVILDNTTQVNQIIELINFKNIFESLKPIGAINATLSIAIETLQMIAYLPGLFKPHKLPEYDEDLTPLLKQQAENLEWMAEFNPGSNYALEITLFESWFGSTSWDGWSPIARKWLYNQQAEYYLDLVNPFLTAKRQTDIGGNNYRLGIAITRKPSQQTTFADENYLRFRVAYSGIVTYEQGIEQKTLQKFSDSLEQITLNQSTRILPLRNNKRHVFYLQNTGKSIIFFNFDENLIGTTSPYLLPGETLSYESGKFEWSGGGNQFFPPMAQYLIRDGVWIFCEGKDKDGKAISKNSVSWIEFYEV